MGFQKINGAYSLYRCFLFGKTSTLKIRGIQLTATCKTQSVFCHAFFSSRNKWADWGQSSAQSLSI
jgi:hypothetical protein